MGPEDITAEFDSAVIAPTAELRIRPIVEIGAKTDMGRVRDNNEDKHEFLIPDSDAELASRGMIFIVCDGMGGHEAGQFASELAVKTFIEVYRNHPAADATDAARAAVLAAHRFVLDVARAIPQRRGMGCTLSAMMVIQDQAVIAHAGDSRVYQLRDGELTQVTLDHTWLEETVSRGVMSREEAEQSQYRHAITRAIGQIEEALVPDILAFPIQVGDLYMICSDGVTNHVSDDAIREVLSTSGPGPAAWSLVNLALAGGGSDNATAFVVRISELRQEPAQETQL